MTAILGVLFSVTAILYAAVGLGGGSGYLAIMGLVGVSPEIMRPTALALNIWVAGIGTWKHVRAGQFSARLFWPIAIVSVPAAFIGGRLSLTAEIYRPVVGLILIYAAARLWLSTRQAESPGGRSGLLPVWTTIIAGAAIGLVSGLVGIGGGIFLGPVLLLAGWAETRQAMGITAAFVVANSIAGLAGNISVVRSLPAPIPVWLLATGIGGWLGSELGSQRLDPIRLRQLLALVLSASGLRMIFL